MTSGIGRALAEKIVTTSPESSVIAIGRRQENLDSLVQKHGQDTISGVSSDITRLDEILSFAVSVIKRYSDLDCVILNSGIQRGFNFANPSSVDMDALEFEFRTNYLSQLALAKEFTSFFQGKKRKKALVL